MPPLIPVPASVRVYGAAGSFSALANMSQTASGHSLAAIPVQGWQFGAGLAAFYTAATGDGKLILSTLPLTSNELKTTMRHAEIDVFDPAKLTFRPLVLPTSLGALETRGPNGLGGTDAGSGDVRYLPAAGKVMFTCAGYYFGWDLAQAGLYPVLGVLSQDPSGVWQYDSGASLTGDQWHATNPSLYESVVAPGGQAAGLNGTYWPTDEANQMAVLPSGNVVIGHYFGPSPHKSGIVTVVSPAGVLLAAYQLPDITTPLGTINWVCVRDVQADPTSAAPDERFCLIYDTFADAGVPTCFQEFSYNGTAHTIAPVTLPCISTDYGVSPVFCLYGSDGALYVSHGAGIAPRNLAVYTKTAGVRSSVTQAPVHAGWESGTWATPVRPDFSLGLAVTLNIGALAGPLVQDPGNGAILLPSPGGTLAAAVPETDPATGALNPLGGNIMSPEDSTFASTQLLTTDEQTFNAGWGGWTVYLGARARGTPPVTPPRGTYAMSMAQYLGYSLYSVRHACAPGQQVDWNVSFLADTGQPARTVKGHVQFMAADGTTTLWSSTVVSGTDSTATWTTLKAITTAAPAGTAYADLWVEVVGEAGTEKHWLAACSLMTLPPLGWTGYATGVFLTDDQYFGGNPVLGIQSVAAGELCVAYGPWYPVTAGQEYLAAAGFRAKTTPGACYAYLEWQDGAGKVTASLSGTGGERATDTTTGLTYVRFGGCAPPGAVQGRVVLRPWAVGNGDIHYATDISLRAQPFKAASLDMAIPQLGAGALYLSAGRASITGGVLYVPVNNPLTAQELADYNASPASYSPQFKPQWLVAVSLAALYGGEPPPVIGPTPYYPPVKPLIRTPWRFLYGPRQPFGGWDGQLGQAQARTVTLRCDPDQNSQAEVTLDGRSPAAAAITELETDLTVMYGSAYIFQGRIGPSADDLSADAHAVTFTASDYRDILRRQALLPADTLLYTATDQAAIAWGLVHAVQAHPGGDLGIAQGAGKAGTGVLRTMQYAAGDWAGDLLGQLAALDNGFDWQITPYGQADLRLDVFYPQQGTDRGVVLQYGMERVAAIRRAVDPAAYADAIYMTGDTSITPALTAVALAMSGIESAPQGRWDQVIGNDLKTQSALADAAAAALSTGQVITPSYTIALQPGSWGGPSDIWIGDQVAVRIRSGRLNVNDSLRVVEMALAIGQDNVEQLTLTVGALPARVHRQITRMMRALAYLNTR
jgi:hypothetical protein